MFNIIVSVMPKVVAVLPDSYADVWNNDYGGKLFFILFVFYGWKSVFFFFWVCLLFLICKDIIAFLLLQVDPS